LAYLVEDVRKRWKGSSGSCTYFHRTVSCPEGALSTLEPALGTAMPAGYDGDTAATLVKSTPGKDAKSGQIEIRLVYALPIASSGGI